MPVSRSSVREAARIAVGVFAASLGAIAAGACGSSDSGASPASSKGDASADASPGSGGSAGAGNGAGGTAPGNGGASTGGSRGGAAGTGALDAGDAEAGSSCPPAPKAPDADYTIEGTCTAPAACGGKLAGTWMLQSLCASDLFTAVRSVCSTAQISVSDSKASGGIAFNGAQATLSLHASASASVTFPNNCSFCQCSGLEAQLASAGLPSASCSPVCSSGTCSCTVRTSVDLEGTHPFTVSGNTATTDPNLSFDFCAGTGTLMLADSTSRSGFQYAKFAAQAPPPEICDGYDNDLNGVVDDNPVECPTCSHAGVCAEGFTATCGGTSGWQCTYQSAKYESPEQSCDGLDNDCNGTVDKLSTCEVCDGIDNDTNGAIDDHLTDTPVCPKAGVCASGTTATCTGSDGWECKGTAATFELVETKCDGLDNDCDGAVDEACPPCSGMKDMWISGGSGTLDLYRGAPTAASGQKILSTAGHPSQVAVDPTASKIYWIDTSLTPAAVQRANFDGSGVETLAATAATGTTGVGCPAVDPGKSLYWCVDGVGVMNAPLASLNTAGSGHAIVTGVAASEVAVAAGKLYYNDSLTRSLTRSDLDGKNARVLVPFQVDDFVVDIIGNHIYGLHFFDFASLNIWSTNLEGAGQQMAAQGFQFTDDFYLSDFAVDPWQKVIYVASSSFIQAAPIGGTARATLVSWTANPTGIALSGCAP